MIGWRQRGFLLNPFRFGAVASVAFVAASSTTYAVSTSQNQTIPAAVEEGDRLLAVVMHRSALTVVPSGWVLVESQSCMNDTTQYTSIYKRLAESGDAAASTTWEQASSGRICVHILAFRRSGGSCDVVDANKGAQNLVSYSAAWNWASLTSGEDGAIGVAASSSILALGPPFPTTISNSSGVLTTIGSDVENRLGVAYEARNKGQTLSGYFTSSISAGTNGIASVSVLIA